MTQRKPWIDPDHPMFSRTWVRVVTVAFPLAWAVLELVLGDPFWAILFGAAGAYAGYQLFIRKR